MATNTMTSKQHDTKITFKDSPTIDGVPMLAADLAGCTLSWLIKNGDGTVALKRAATISPTGGGPSGTDPLFSYDPVPADVAVIGKYEQEWEVVFPNAKILTFPNDGYNILKIIADLG